MRELGTPAFAKKHVRAIAGSILLAAVFAWVMRRGSLPIVPPSGALSRVDRFYFIAFVLAMIVHALARFVRVYFLTEPIAHVSLRRMVTINAISMVFITVLPLRLGEVARPAMLRTKGHLSAWAVGGTVFAERILDGLVYSVVLLSALGLATRQEPLPDTIGGLPVPAALVPAAGRVASLVFAGAFFVMAAFYRFRAIAMRLTERVIGVVSVRLGQRVASVVSRVSDGLRFLTNPRYTAPYLVVTLISASAHIWAIEWLAHAVGMEEVTFAQSALITGVLSLGFILPNAPGFFGSVQLALYAGLAVCVSPAKVIGEGAVFVFLFYVTYLVMIVGLGAAAFGLEYWSPSEEPRAKTDNKQQELM